MPLSRFFKPQSVLRHALVAAALIGASSAATAAPYAINYRGQAVQESGAGSNLPGTWGGGYNVTLVFDNGGTSSASQTWDASHLKCAIWVMRRNGSTVFEQNLFLHPVPTQSGSVTTDASGALSSVFTTLGQTDNMLPASAYTFVSPSLLPSPPDIVPGQPYWFIPNVPGTGGAPGFSGVFYIDSAGFDDAAGGVSVGTNVTGWTAPVAYPQTTCAGQPFSAPVVNPPTAGNVASVPVMGLPGLALMGLAAAGLGALRLRRKKA